MNDLIIPNWHPLLVHFTVALVITSTGFFVLSKLFAKQAETFSVVAKWVLWTAAGVTILTVLAGFSAYNSVNHDDIAHEVMKTHRVWALVTAAAILLVAVWAYKSKTVSAVLVAASLGLTGLVGAAGYFGSELVYRHGLGVMRLPDSAGAGHAHSEGGGDHEHAATTPETKDHDHDGPTDEQGHDDVDQERKPEGGHDHPGMSALDFAKHFQEALFGGDFDMVSGSFAADAIVFENGVKEASLESYLNDHLKPEMPILAAAEHTVVKQDVRLAGDMAIVTTASTLSIKSNEKIHDFLSVETLGLMKQHGEWKIFHVHSSSRPVKRN